jgi:hypothetical protein
VGEQNARLQNILTGQIEKNLVNCDHLKLARERRQILHQYWQETQNQALPSDHPSTSQEAEPAAATASNTPEPQQVERAR